MRFATAPQTRPEPNFRLAGQAMLGASALFGIGNQTGSTAAVYAALAVALYAVLIAGGAWRLVLDGRTWALIGGLIARLAVFALAIVLAGALTHAGPVFGALGSLAFIAVLCIGAFAIGSLTWRWIPRALSRTLRAAGNRSHVVGDFWVLVRASI
jgi:hypothetical protein